MSNEYQPIFDAVRSKIHNGDVGSAVENAIRDANFPHYAQMVAQEFQNAACEMQRPFVLLKPKVFIEAGNEWCALYGENIQDGVAGFGESPAKAAWDFDKNWNKKIENHTQGEPKC